MLNRLYWIVVSLVLAVAVHAAYLLIAPGLALEHSMARTGALAARNAFQVLKPEEQSALFPTFPPSSVFGVCAFDVSKSGVELSAALPEGYWTLTVYSRSGDVIYALNSRQSGTNNFTVSLTRAPGLMEALTSTASDDPGSFNGWKVATPEDKGIAVLWVPLQETAQRAAVTRVLQQSRCKLAA